MNSSQAARITNSSNNIPCSFEDTTLSRTLKISALFFGGGFGIFSNVFIVVLALKHTTKTNLHHLIINMAVSDAFNILATLGLKLPHYLKSFTWNDFKIISGNILCKCISFFVTISVSVSYTTLLIISIERFRASRSTVQISQPYTLKQRLAVVACSWLISAAIAAHETPYRAIEQPLSGSYMCKGSSTVPFGLSIFVYTVLIIAFFCIIILSAVTLRRLSQVQEIEASLPEAQRKARAKRISSAIKMVVSSLFLYSICYIPFIIWVLIKLFTNDSADTNLIYCYDVYIFDFVTAILPVINSCLSPGIYLTFLSDFRKAAKAIICRKIGRNAVAP